MIQIILQHQIIYLKISQTEGSMTSVDNSKHGVGVESVRGLDRLQENSVHSMSNLPLCLHIWLISHRDNNAVFILWHGNNEPERKA